MSSKSLIVNLACPRVWRKDSINVSPLNEDVPNGHDFLRAGALDLEHYFYPRSVDEFILPPFNTEGMNTIINRLLKPGGKVRRELC
jgi:hypothetical protein